MHRVETVESRFVVHAGVAGRVADPVDPVEAALADVGELDAPAAARPTPCRSTPSSRRSPPPRRPTAKAAAERVAAEITLDREDGIVPTITTVAAALLAVTFAPTADGGYAPTVDTTEPAARPQEARQEDQPGGRSTPRSRPRGGRITGVTPSKTGYKMDVDATAKQVEALIAARLAGGTGNDDRADDHGHPAGPDDRRGQGRSAEDAQDLDSGRRTSRSATRTASAPTSGSRPGSSTATSSRRARRSTSGTRSDRSPGPRATRPAARSSTARPSRRAPSPAASARARRRSSTPPSGPATRWAPGATTTTTSTAIRSASTRPCSSAHRARSRRCRSRTTPTTRSSSAATDPQRRHRLREVRALQRADRPQGQHRDRPQRNVRQRRRHGAVHLQPAARRRASASSTRSNGFQVTSVRGPSATGTARSSTRRRTTRTTRGSPASRSSAADAHHVAGRRRNSLAQRAPTIRDPTHPADRAGLPRDRPRRPWAMASASVALTPNRRSA